LVHNSNVFIGILVSCVNILTVCNFEHDLNTLVPIDETLSGIFISLIKLHPSKTELPSDFIEFPNEIVSNLLHPLKTLSPIVVPVESSNVTVVNPVHDSNELIPID
jgi:hypothetical protein